MTTTKITPKEFEMLKAIVESEYQDGNDVVNAPIWFDYIVNSWSTGGVFTGLQAKGLVGSFKTEQRSSPEITDSTIHITAAGLEAYTAASKKAARHE